ncbi:hypothetical protein CC80DRAFT_537136 [Byssothecium circinans]|uniref:Uncharacterized protein n=1 Tax=Byssothecium circinans TaxID=147558 RepID=A0A6A5TLV6_9PLEO|nr:hypothetical protein CC80DRAFT_537136 [Byssothecium circinans]
MPDLSPSFVASIARALNSTQVPCVLWGHYLLNIHGVPSIIGSIDFVIPDDLLHVSIETLFKIGTLSPCLRGGLCPSSPQQRYSPPPAFHIHIDDSEVTANLYPQSKTLWFLPPLDGSLSSPRTAKLPLYLVVASDQTILPQRRPGRRSGVFSSTEYPVLLPRASPPCSCLVRSVFAAVRT